MLNEGLAARLWVPLGISAQQSARSGRRNRLHRAKATPNSVLFFDWLRGRRTGALSPLVTLGSGWVVGAAIATWASVRFTTPELRAYMRNFWASGFAPFEEGSFAVVRWGVGRVYHVLAHYLIFLDAEFGVLAAPVAVLALGGLVKFYVN